MGDYSKYKGHTPGPWRRRGDTVIGPIGNVIAECCGYSVMAEDEAQRKQGGREANAALIAAAPDLLDTLEAAIGRIEIANAEGDPILSAWLPDAKATVARAKGEI